MHVGVLLDRRDADVHRDDLTVEVIFFGEEEGRGDVVLNAEASAQMKARL